MIRRRALASLIAAPALWPVLRARGRAGADRPAVVRQRARRRQPRPELGLRRKGGAAGACPHRRAAVDGRARPARRPVLLSGARALGLDLQWLDVADAADLERAVERAAQGRAQGLYAPATNLIVANRRRIAELAQRARLPAISEFPLMAQAGFVLSYGTDLAALARRVASFVDKIVKGARPGDLPIELPSKFELVTNLGAARAIGLTLPAARRPPDRLAARRARARPFTGRPRPSRARSRAGRRARGSSGRRRRGRTPGRPSPARDGCC